MRCYAWELEALLEGLTLKSLDEQEMMTSFGFSLRYILNAKKPQFKKVFNKAKQENKIKNMFNKLSSKEQSNKTQSVVDALNHFKNRG